MRLTTPHRVQLSRIKGWRMPPNTIKVARPSGWGNPWVVGGIDHATGETVRDRAHAARLFEERWFGGAHASLEADAIHELRGYNLACWCPLDKPCHADVLLRIANR